MAPGVPPLSNQQQGKRFPCSAQRQFGPKLHPCGGGETKQQFPYFSRSGPTTPPSQFSLFSSYLAVAQTLSPVLFTLISPVFLFFSFSFHFHIPLRLQSKPMRGKSNNCRAGACHHLVCLAHWVINVFCWVLCKARICPCMLVMCCYPNVHCNKTLCQLRTLLLALIGVTWCTSLDMSASDSLQCLRIPLFVTTLHATSLYDLSHLPGVFAISSKSLL